VTHGRFRAERVKLATSPSMHAHMPARMRYGHRGNLARRNPSSLVTVSPGIQGILPRRRTASTPLSYHPPCPSSNDLFHGPFIADQVCQRFRPGFTRKEAGRVWIQPFVNNSFAISCGLCLSQYQIRIIRVGTGCNSGAVIEDI
jgi:hypothetical protein